MGHSAFARRFPVLAGALVAVLALMAGTVYIQSGMAGGEASRYAPNVMRGDPRYVDVGRARAGILFQCQLTTPASCFSPRQMRVAYAIQPLLDAGITGRGRTIVIVDAFQAPEIGHDLSLFDNVFGLNHPLLNIFAPDGLTPFDPTNFIQVGWSGEISLDVEWAHAIAPDATIDLVLAKSDQDADILAATRFAVEHNLGDVISQSFGEAESCVNPQILRQQHEVFMEAARKGMTLLASSGDIGAAQPTCDGKSFARDVSSPASDPLVTSVGGTKLDINGLTGEYRSEVTWNDPFGLGASGGGFSTLYRRPFYQEGTRGIGQFRGVPDVAFDAALERGVLTVWSTSGLGLDQIFRIGGTSAGAPQWAGITALGCQFGQRRLGPLNGALYAIGHAATYTRAFHDIVLGNNSFSSRDLLGHFIRVRGYNAARGWDATTGLGSPIAAKLVPLLVQQTTPRLAHQMSKPPVQKHQRKPAQRITHRIVREPAHRQLRKPVKQRNVSEHKHTHKPIHKHVHKCSSACKHRNAHKGDQKQKGC